MVTAIEVYNHRLDEARQLAAQAVAELDDRKRHPVLPVALASNRLRDALKILSNTVTGDVPGDGGLG